MIDANGQRPRGNIPERNPFFTGQEEILDQLYHAFSANNTATTSHPLGITGLGGVGKTQIAIEYAYRYASEYRAALWVQADSASALTSGFAKLAEILELPESNEQDQQLIVEAVLRWLRYNSGWLLVFDNVDDLAVATPFLPTAARGHIMLTTRSHALGGNQRLQVQPMPPETGALLLLRRADFLPPQALLDAVTNDTRITACNISRELDGLPLALDQAGAYIKETPCSLTDYLARYQACREDVLQDYSSTNYPASVATTWSLSFEKVGQAHPAAKELLNFCAFLAPDAIPEEIITEGAPHLGAVLSSMVTDRLQFNQIYKDILRYSLLQRAADEGTLTLHRLVQAVLQDNLSAETRTVWKQRAVQAVNATFPEVRFDYWKRCERFLAHALVCAKWVEQEHFNKPEIIPLLNSTGSYLFARGRYGEVELLHKQALAIAEQAGEDQQLALSTTLHNLAVLYRTQGKYKEAELLYRQVLTLDQQLLGAEHAQIATDLAYLGDLYREQGKYEDAAMLLERALAINERVHYIDPFVLSVVGGLYLAQGRYGEARQVVERAFSVDEQHLGAEHPETLTALHNLAVLYEVLGKYEEAETLFKRTLALQEAQLGVEHPAIIVTLTSLGRLYQVRGNYEEAERLYRRALAQHEQQLGAEHPNTALILTNLGDWCRNQGNYAEAEQFLRRALAIYEEKLGTDHPDTALMLSHLAHLYWARGEYTEVVPLLQRAITIHQERLGAEHLHTAVSLNNLAELCQAFNKYTEAEHFAKQALSIYKKQLGAGHSYTALGLTNLAHLYTKQQRYAEAEPLLLRSRALREAVLGLNHPDTALTLNNLGGLYLEQKQYAKAEPLFQRALAIDEGAYGENHPVVAADLNNLGGLCMMQERYAEAEPLLQRALAIREALPEPHHPETASIQESLGALYMLQEKYPEAEILLRRALSIRDAGLFYNPHSLPVLTALGSLYMMQKKYDEAERFLRRAINVAEGCFGYTHPRTREAWMNYSAVAMAMGAEKIRKGWKKLFGRFSRHRSP
jgi:tetratricopeptide (TPR) repeat protein